MASVTRAELADMRLAIVSDIHGNLTALDAVAADIAGRGVDRVVHGGDLALGGCQPALVIDQIREVGWPGIVGNTDELLCRPEEQAVQERKAPNLRPLMRLLFETYAPATRALIGDERIAWLRQLPDAHREDDLLLLHASPHDLWWALGPGASDFQLKAMYGSCDATVVVYGHIHRPYTRYVDRLTVANSGSVGSPYDGDPRASYVLVDSGHVQIVRVEYDIEREIDLLLRSSYPDAQRIAETRRLGRFVAVSD